MKNIFLSKITRKIYICLNASLNIYMFLIAKNSYSFSICLTTFVLSLLSVFLYLSIRDNKNAFDFDVIFLVAFIFTYFIYPVFIFPVNKTRFFMFNYGFNESVITKSTLLASIGLHFFLIGLFSKSKKNNSFTKFTKKYSLSVVNLFIYLFVFLHFIQVFVLKIGLVYSEKGNANPATSTGIWGYLSILRTSVIMVALVFYFNNYFRGGKKKLKIQDIVLWIGIIFEILIIISTGSRGGALGIILVTFAGFAILKGGFSYKKLLLLMFIGMAFLSLIVVLRSGSAFKFSFNIIDMAMDLIINNYTIFLCYDYVEKFGLVPFTLIGSLLSAIPFLAGLAISTFNISIYESSSARFFSVLALGNNPKFGVGTNIVASLYLATGLIGVIVFMFLFGVFIKKINISPNKINAPILKLFLYFEMMSVAVYMVRADFFYQVGKIVFGLVFLYLCSAAFIWKYKK